MQDSHADVEQLLQHAHRGPQHVPAHVMSGKKLDKRYDIPVNIGFLDEYSDHQPALGSGKLDVIMGPMFAGKTTALLNQVRWSYQCTTPHSSHSTLLHSSPSTWKA